MLKHQQLESKPQTNVSKIEQILAQQLASGDITPQVYLEVVSHLKSKHEAVSFLISPRNGNNLEWLKT